MQPSPPAGSNVRALGLDLTPDEAKWLETGVGPDPAVELAAKSATREPVTLFAR